MGRGRPIEIEIWSRGCVWCKRKLIVTDYKYVFRRVKVIRKVIRVSRRGGCGDVWL